MLTVLTVLAVLTVLTVLTVLAGCPAETPCSTRNCCHTTSQAQKIYGYQR
jgi:hypothetical protein